MSYRTNDPYYKNGDCGSFTLMEKYVFLPVVKGQCGDFKNDRK